MTHFAGPTPEHTVRSVQDSKSNIQNLKFTVLLIKPESKINPPHTSNIQNTERQKVCQSKVSKFRMDLQGQRGQAGAEVWRQNRVRITGKQAGIIRMESFCKNGKNNLAKSNAPVNIGQSPRRGGAFIGEVGGA